MSEKAVEYLSKQIENINNKLKEISDDIHCVDIEINTINDKITLIDNNTDKTEDMFISFGNEVFERNQNELLKSKIDDLLKQSFMTKSYFITQFKKLFNISPMQYLTLVRLEQAKLLLSKTTDTITDIALKVGFNNPVYFAGYYI